MEIRTGRSQNVNTETNKQKYCGFGPRAEVMSEVMPEVMSAENALNKWSEVFFIIVWYLFFYTKVCLNIIKAKIKKRSKI